MNLTNFLKQTDAITAQYSAAQLTTFIHEIARILPEHHREKFLKRLKEAGQETEKISDKNQVKDADFNERYKQIRNNLKLIDSQEVTISSTLNEEYDDWYDNDSEEFYYEDESGISGMLEEACDFVHTCMDMERYKEGFEIGNQLLTMEILCFSDYGGEDLSLADMMYHELLHCDLNKVIFDTAYCAYHARPLKQRAEALYQVIVNGGRKEITLEAIMQYGDEDLPDFQDFLPLWIGYLGDQAGRDADRLILEAVGLLNDVSMAVQYAEKYAAVHPGIYLDILENEKYTDGRAMAAVGMEALRIVPKKYIVRSRIALKTAEYLIAANTKQPLPERCYFAAYESDTSPLNYIRVLLNGYGDEEKREELRKVFLNFSADQSGASYGTFERSYSLSEREENKPDRNMILALKFLDGQFAEVLAKGLNKSEALGWSGTFMKQGIALYLLYLYEGRWIGKGIAAMISIAKNAMGFSAEEYRNGTCEDDGTDEDTLFWNLFHQWKSMVKMAPDVRTRAIKRITVLIEKRTEGIMDANRRNYYVECAAYIAALGEVQESLGDTGAKQGIMTFYKEKYSRRSAFRAELRDYGWIDSKRR